MDTKLKNWARSRITKTILFATFLTTVWGALYFSASLCDVGIHDNLPFESLQSPQPEDSYTVRQFEENLFSELLYPKGDITNVWDYDKVPTVYYRAEYPDGSVVTNVEAQYKAQGDDFFRSHKVFAIMATDADGKWREASRKDISPRRYGFYPQPIMQDSTIYTSVTAHTNGLGFTSITEQSTYPVVEEKEDPDENRYGWSPTNPCPTVRISYAFDDASLAAMTEYYSECRSYLMLQFSMIALLSLVAILSAVWLLVTCGRRSGSTELHPMLIDRIPAEFQCCLFFGWGALFVLLCMWGCSQLMYVRFQLDAAFFLAIITGATVVAGMVLLWFMSIVRMFKARTFFRKSITFRICYWFSRPFAKLWDIARSCFDERSFRAFPLTLSLVKRQEVFLSVLGAILLLILIVAIAAGAEVGFVAVFALFLFVIASVTCWHISGNRKTYEQINQGMSDSVAEQMKSERTKTALITNVSHDLKTPLTSIITYVDLLSQEELSDTARDYVTVLEQKSERLKAMVSDLFDLAKSSSGNLPLDLEVLDLHRLLEQTLADMRDSIDASGLTLKTSFPEGEVSIYSDGKKLYRVFQNIIGNTLKYSLAGTRVYVSLELVDGRAVATVRNTAGYEMDFTADEVLQRFVRGDKSRSGEGSGLGLSIADSFTTACGGEFMLAIDGDLFKVTTSFPLSAASRAVVTSNA